MNDDEACELFEKRLANRKFRQNEEKILKTFFEEDNYISTTEMARRAKMSRSTLHRHHKKVAWIVVDYERYILWKYNRIVRRLMRQERTSVKQLYFQMLFFIKEHRAEFKTVVLRGKSRRLLEKMVVKLRPKLVGKLRLKGDSKKKFKVYVSGVVEILTEWGEQGFKASEMERTLADVMYLTEAAPMGLKGLED